MKNVNSPRHARFSKRVISSFYSILKTSWRCNGSHLPVFEKFIFFNYFRQLTDVVFSGLWDICTHLDVYMVWRQCTHLNVYTDVYKIDCVRICTHLDVYKIMICTHLNVYKLWFVHIWCTHQMCTECVHIWMCTKSCSVHI